MDCYYHLNVIIEAKTVGLNIKQAANEDGQAMPVLVILNFPPKIYSKPLFVY